MDFVWPLKWSICFVVITLLSSQTHAQLSEHTWFLGGTTTNEEVRLGIRFDPNTNEPEDFSDVRFPLDLRENNIIINNPATGEPVFYSDGQTVVDASNRPMPNGSGLNGTPSTMYGTSVVYHPQFCSSYYIIYGEDEIASPPRNIYYSLVDLTLPGNGTIGNPLGDVVADRKNIPLFGDDINVGEGLFALTKSPRSRESWVFAASRRSKELFVIDVSEDDVRIHQRYALEDLFPSRLNPDVNLFGIRLSYHEDGQDQGRLVVAIARNENDSEAPLGYVTFNRTDGLITSGPTAEFIGQGQWTYGLAFSPDGTKLYYSDYFAKTLTQYTFADRSNVLISTSSHTGRSGGLKLAPDGKIYWANRFNNINGPNVRSLATINFPNRQGTACDLEYDAYPFPDGNQPRILGALPTFGTFPLPPRTEVISRPICSDGKGSARVIPNTDTAPFTFLWDNGETSQTATSLSVGRHTVTVTGTDGCAYEASVRIEPDNRAPSASDYTTSVINGTGCTRDTLGRLLITSTRLRPSSSYTLVVLNTDLDTTQEIVTESRDDGAILLEGLSPGNYSLVSISGSTACESISMADIPFTVREGSDQLPSFALDYPALIETDECTTIQLSPGDRVPDSIQITWLNEDLSCDSCFTPEYFVVQDTTLQYVLEHAASGCSEMDSVIVRIVPDLNLYIPNAISPNGDGLNDGFTVFTKNDRTIIESMRIFDRWGTLLFEGQNLPVNQPSAGWSGALTTYSRNERVFIYYVKVRFLDGSTEEDIGNVHILR